jgi:hypothetical protein
MGYLGSLVISAGSSISQKPSISRSGCAVGLNRLRLRSASVWYRLEPSYWTLAPMLAHKCFHSPARWEIQPSPLQFKRPLAQTALAIDQDGFVGDR